MLPAQALRPRQAQAPPPRVAGVVRVPGWLVFVIFVPLQVWLFLNLVDVWGFWWTLPFFLLLGVLGARAGTPPWLRAALFPQWAQRWEERRHLYQGILLLLAAGSWLLPQAPEGVLPAGLEAWADGWPQPWLPLAYLVTLVKSALR